MKKKPVCWACGQLGHVKKNCPKCWASSTGNSKTISEDTNNTINIIFIEEVILREGHEHFYGMSLNIIIKYVLILTGSQAWHKLALMQGAGIIDVDYW